MNKLLSELHAERLKRQRQEEYRAGVVPAVPSVADSSDGVNIDNSLLSSSATNTEKKMKETGKKICAYDLTNDDDKDGDDDDNDDDNDVVLVRTTATATKKNTSDDDKNYASLVLARRLQEVDKEKYNSVQDKQEGNDDLDLMSLELERQLQQEEE
jgi:hypothetical protein